jgi:hypothetical protein
MLRHMIRIMAVHMARTHSAPGSRVCGAACALHGAQYGAHHSM